jgi:hypothetical protein
MLSFIFVVVCGLFEWKQICAGFQIVCLYLYYCWRSNYQGEVVYICIAVGDPIIKGRLFISVLLLEIQFSRGGCLYLYCCWRSNYQGEVVYFCITVGDPIIKGRLFISVLLLEIQLSRGGCLYLYYCWRSSYQGKIVYFCIAVGDPIIKGRVVYICIGEGWDLIIKRGGVEIPLSCLTLPHLCACPKPCHRFPTIYVVVFFVNTDFKWEVVVCFVDIGGIVGHLLNFFFIIYSIQRAEQSCDKSSNYSSTLVFRNQTSCFLG